MPRLRTFASIALALFALAGCDDDPTTDAGPGDDGGPALDSGPRADSGPRPDAGPSDDAGPGDDAGTDAGPGIEQSRLTAVLPTPLTFDAVDDMGNPLVIDAAHAFDHDTMPGETIFVAAGDTRLQLGVPAGTTVPFVNPVTWVDGASGALMPDLLFAGAIGANPELLIGVFGSDFRVYAFATDSFGDAAMFNEMGAGPFTPISATTVDLGTGASIIALKSGSPNLYVFDGSQFAPFPVAPVRCSDGGAINPTIVVGAEIAGATPPGGADSVLLIEGSSAYALEAVSPAVCFSDALALTDAAGAAVTPEIAFGADFDGNGTDDLILVDRVVR